MKFRLLFLFFILTVVVFSCGKKNDRHQESAETAYPVLTGWLNEHALMAEIPEMGLEKQRYQPDIAAVTALKNYNNSVNILVMLGSWCSDSRREVPRFLKVMDEVHNGNIRYEMYGLDRGKRDSIGLGEKNQIEFVPTFIVFNEMGEIGRIVETPIFSIEQDLAEILAETIID